MIRRLTLVLFAVGSFALPFAAPAPAASAAGTVRLARTMDRTINPYHSTSGTSESFSTPAIADVSGDATPEIVVAGMDGTVFAYRSDGSVLWSKHVANAAIEASPVLADVGGDGIRDVVIGAMDGSVVWLNGPNGAIVRRFVDTPSLACRPGVYCKPRGFFATPAVADIDGDGAPEIIAASWDHQLYAWHRNGSTFFRRFLEDTLWSSPVVVDIDNNGSKEIILGGDRYADAAHPGGGGYLWVLRSNGSNYPGYPKYLPGQVIWSSPAVADLNGDHRLDITFGTGLNFASPDGHRVYAYSAASATPLAGWPVSTPGRVIASPAVADLDGDGRDDVVVASEGGYVQSFSGTGRRMWSACNAINDTFCGPGYATHGGATIADVDNDGALDVVSTLDKHLRVYRASNGALERSYLLGSKSFAPASAATIAEVGGKTWIVQNTVMDNNGVPGRNSGDISRTWVFTTDTALGAAPWPTFHRDAARSGVNRSGTESWYPLPTASTFIRQQYQDFLNRSADSGGLTYWTGKLTSGSAGSELIVRFLTSTEFGRALSPVVRVHLGLFGTPPTNYSVLNAQLSAARNGASPAALADLLIAGSPTVQAKSGSRFIQDAYAWAWGKNATSAQMSAGLAFLNAGATRGQVVASIVNAGEAVWHLNSRVNVSMTYAGMLRRVPDSSGYHYWVEAIESGASIGRLTSLFQYTGEYYQRFH